MSTPFQKQTSFPKYTHLISPRLDPIFALLVGVSAAVVRIRREEREKGFTAQETIERFKRRAILTYHQPWGWNSLIGEKKEGVGKLVEEEAGRRVGYEDVTQKKG